MEKQKSTKSKKSTKKLVKPEIESKEISVQIENKPKRTRRPLAKKAKEVTETTNNEVNNKAENKVDILIQEVDKGSDIIVIPPVSHRETWFTRFVNRFRRNK